MTYTILHMYSIVIVYMAVDFKCFFCKCKTIDLSQQGANRPISRVVIGQKVDYRS